MLAISPIYPPEDFNARVNRLSHAHARMARGYAAKISPSGLIVFYPKRGRRPLPLQLMIVPIVALFGFKLLALSRLAIAPIRTISTRWPRVAVLNGRVLGLCR